MRWLPTNLIIVLLLTLVILPGNAQTEGRIKIIATNPDLVPIVEMLGGDGVEIITLMPPGTDPDNFTPSSESLQEVESSDLIILTNSQSIQFEREILESFHDINYIDLPEYQDNGVIFKAFPGYELNRHGYWLGHENAKAIAGVIADSLVSSGLDSEMVSERLSIFKSDLDAITQAGNDLIHSLDRERSVWVAMIPEVAYVIDNLGLEVGDIVKRPDGEFATGQDLQEITNNLFDINYAGIVIPKSMNDSEAGNIAWEIATETRTPICYVRFLDNESGGSFITQAAFNAGTISIAASRGTQAGQPSNSPTGTVIWAIIVFALLIFIVMLNTRNYRYPRPMVMEKPPKKKKKK